MLQTVTILTKGNPKVFLSSNKICLGVSIQWLPGYLYLENYLL